MFDNKEFIIGDGLNTSYIDTLIVSLFYNNNKFVDLMDILTLMPENIDFVYLQELIINNVVNNINKNLSIDSSIINEIRNYCISCGWKNDNKITELHNIIEFYDWFITGVYGIHEPIIKFESTNEKIYTNYIELVISYDTDIRVLLQSWINNYNNFTFREVPILLPIYLSHEKNYIIDIKKQIRIDSHTWSISSIICLDKMRTGHYYSLINLDNDTWYMFSNDKIPSFYKIDIKNPITASKIKQECVLLFYRMCYY